jgi:hypothetical protein
MAHSHTTEDRAHGLRSVIRKGQEGIQARVTEGSSGRLQGNREVSLVSR